MNMVLKKYDHVTESDLICEMESLNEAIENKDYVTIENMFSVIFIYQFENIQLVKDVSEYICSKIDDNSCLSVIYFQTGLALNDVAELDEAKVNFSKAVEYQIKVENREYITLAMIYMHLNNYSKAIEEFKKCDLTKHDTLMHLANCYMKNEQYDEAIEIFTKKIVFDNKHPEFYKINEKIGWCYMFLNNYNEANEWFLKANMVNNVHMLMETAEFYQLKKEYDLAIKQLYHLYDLGEVVVMSRIKYLENLISVK